MNGKTMVALAAALVSAGGCISVKTESEVKPIHITMDVNLKVDRELEREFSGESMTKPSGDFKEMRALLDRKVAGVGKDAMFVAREGATDDERIMIAESNARRLQRFSKVAKESGVKLESVQRRSLERFREKVPAGSGVWIQSDDGNWGQK